MYGPRPIRFSAHRCADYSKYRGFLVGGISTASSYFFWNTAPPPKLQSRTHTTSPATQASAGVIRCSHKFHNHLLCLLPLPVLYPLTVFSKSKSSSSFTSKHGPYVSSKTEIVKYARKIRRAKRRMRLNGSR